MAERVSSAADAGELIVSDATAQRLSQPLEGAEQRELKLKGVAEPVTAWSFRPWAPGPDAGSTPKAA